MVSRNHHSSDDSLLTAAEPAAWPTSRMRFFADDLDRESDGIMLPDPRPSSARRLAERLAPQLLRPAVIFVLTIGVVSAAVRGHGLKTSLKHLLHTIVHGTPAAAPALFPVAEGTPDPAIRFEKVMLPAATGAGFTCVRIGPDHRLYASSDDGRIYRFAINGDGTLAQPRVITALQKHEGGKRLVTGFCFDAAATANEPVIWVAHGFHAFHHAPDFSGRITRMRGQDLETVDDIVINLPRSAKDHLTNQPAFGPDGALYIPQGSNTASGAPDAEWENRPEHLLNATVLRLDVTKVMPGEPLDARTVDAGGHYDPRAAGAPLTIYAEGLRNPYSLVWASNGRLYVPVNGSSSGGSTPAGPGVPGLVNLSMTENDWLFRITPGRYYGHPNPQQGHFVLNGGNPGNRSDSSVIPEYPIGTMPDADWQPADFDFGPHVSADGIMEYRGRAFDGRLDRKLLVCRFNVGSDLICLGLDAAGKVNSVQTHIAGLYDFVNPLSLCEDSATGNLYISEYGAHRLTLARPAADAAVSSSAGHLSDSPESISSSDVQQGKALYGLSCIVCHGPEGRGVPSMGANLRDSRFVSIQTDESLAAFIKTGRPSDDPKSILKLTMPPNGGNPTLDDTARRQLVAYLRWMQAHGSPG